jgi:zinc protease
MKLIKFPSYSFYRETLYNGLTLVLIPLKDDKIVSVGIFIKVGSRYEHKENSGISHFLEHMTFGGTNTRTENEIMSKLDSIGALYNAATSREYTYFYANGNFKDANILLDIILDIYMNPCFPEKKINKERAVVLEELGMHNDDNQMLLYDDVMDLVYDFSTIGDPILGTYETVSNITKKDLNTYHDKYYTPNNSILVVSGNFNYSKMYNSIVKKFRKKQYDKQIITRTSLNIQQTIPQLSIIYGKQLFQTNVIITFRSFKHTDKRNYTLDIISRYLTSGFTSVLFTLLRTKLGVAYACSASNETYTDHGIFYIMTGLEGKRAVEAIILIFEELKKIRKGNIDDNIFKSAKKIFETSMLFDLSSPFDYMMSHGMKELEEMGNISNEYILEEIRKITVNDIKKVASEVFISKNMNISILCEKLDKNQMIHCINNFD